MSLECSECERDARGGHDPSCSRSMMGSAAERATGEGEPKWVTSLLDERRTAWADECISVDNCSHSFHRACVGEICHCGNDATHKVGEELSDPTRHNLTTYICCAHFRQLMGPAAPCGKEDPPR